MRYVALSILLILILSNVSAIVVSDISNQIEQGNSEIIQSNAEIQASLSQTQDALNELSGEVKQNRSEMLKREDLIEFYSEVDAKLSEHSTNVLALNLTCIIFAFACLFLAKSKKWL